MTVLPCAAKSASSSFDSGRFLAPGILSRACSSASRMSTRIAPRSRRSRASAGLIVGSDILAPSTDFSALRFDGRAKQLVQRGEELLDARIGDAIPERLAFPPERDEPLLAHFCKMLG